MIIIDISPLVTEASPVYPGDAPLSLRFEKAPNVRVGTLTMSAHLGAHIDAPLHLNRAADVSEIDPARLIGDCQVIEVVTKSAIEPEDFPPIICSRVLIKSGFTMPETWTENFAYLSAQATSFLIDKGVTLIGIDTPSIDKAGDDKLQSHVLAIDAGLIILENLDLSKVCTGHYQLIALPLKIQGLDAGPVRAVLIDTKEKIKNGESF